jgi:hypothetical protein
LRNTFFWVSPQTANPYSAIPNSRVFEKAFSTEVAHHSTPDSTVALVSGAKPMRLAQIVGDAAECPLWLFVNPGRTRVPQTVVFDML